MENQPFAPNNVPVPLLILAMQGVFYGEFQAMNSLQPIRYLAAGFGEKEENPYLNIDIRAERLLFSNKKNSCRKVATSDQHLSQIPPRGNISAQLLLYRNSPNSRLHSKHPRLL